MPFLRRLIPYRRKMTSAQIRSTPTGQRSFVITKMSDRVSSESLTFSLTPFWQDNAVKAGKLNVEDAEIALSNIFAMVNDRWPFGVDRAAIICRLWHHRCAKGHETKCGRRQTPCVCLTSLTLWSTPRRRKNCYACLMNQTGNKLLSFDSKLPAGICCLWRHRRALTLDNIT